MLTRARLVGITVAAAVAVATGCGSSSPVDSRAVGTTHDPVVEPRDLSILAGAREELISRCMREHGYEYRVPSIDELRQEQLDNASAPFGFWSRDDVARWVRDGGRPTVDAASIRANDKIKAAMTPREKAGYARAFFGPAGPDHGVQIELPDGEKIGMILGGCNGTALRQLFGDPVEWTRLESSASSLRIKVQEKTRDTDAFKDALGKWQDCASARGISAPTPFEAAAGLRRSAADAAEHGINVIWDCQRQARLIEVAEAQELNVARDETRDYEGTILAYRERVRATLNSAQRVLAGGP